MRARVRPGRGLQKATDSESLATDLSTLEANLLKWTFGIVLSVAGIRIAILMAALRFLG